MKALARKAATTVAVGAIALVGLTACSSADDAKDAAKDGAASVTSAAGSAADAAKDGAASATSAVGSAVDSAINGKTTEVEGPDGKKLEVPAAVASAWESAGGVGGSWGAPESVTEKDGNTLVTFADAWVVTTAGGEAVPVVGKIGATWAEGGALDNEIGLPTGPESGNATTGWTQKFTNGTIGWKRGADGEWAAETA